MGSNRNDESAAKKKENRKSQTLTLPTPWLTTTNFGGADQQQLQQEKLLQATMGATLHNMNHVLDLSEIEESLRNTVIRTDGAHGGT